MNILKRELRSGLRPFLFWTLGLFLLVFSGVVKYTGVEAGGESARKLTESFPRIVRAVLGVVGLDIGSFGGYYAILAYYVLVVTAVYAVSLGGSAVTREAADKTYEFVFTKPRSRTFILGYKLLAGFFYLAFYCLLCFAFSAAAVSALKLGEDVRLTMFLFSLAAFLCGLVFFALSALFAAASARIERGARLGNLFVLAAFALGVVCDMLENGGILRLFTPFKYFNPAELLRGRLDPAYTALCLALFAAALYFAFRAFEKRDLTAS